MDSKERLEILLTGAAKAEAAADEERPVTPGQLELVHRLGVQRRSETFPLGGSTAEREHVGRDVATVDVEARAEEGEQQPARSARDVERRLSVRLDLPPEVVELGASLIELGPPARDDAVVPRLRKVGSQ